MRRRRLVSVVLIAAFILALAPATAQAANGTITAAGSYDLADYGDGSTITIATPEPVTLIGSVDRTYADVQIVCNEGTNLTLNNVKINNDGLDACALSFTGQGNTLTLTGENMLTSGDVHPGVKVASGTTLVIDATDDTGSLTANGGSWGGAGIGGGSNGGAGGTVTINGGKVSATGGVEGGAGIGGGGASGGDGGAGGIVTINGGEVTAEGGGTHGYDGAGIGGGGGWHSGGAGGTVTINGGEVTANGYAYAAGIGGGSGYSRDGGDGGTIEISGGRVTATGGDGAGIGGGATTASPAGVPAGAGGTITISGGEVTATSIAGAGIGGAEYGNGGTITISGGTVTARSMESGAGIGGGRRGDGGTITISGGTVTARSEQSGAGIGGGESGASGSIAISGGTVNAKGGAGGADIGGTPTNGLTPAEYVFLTTVTIEDAGRNPVGSTPILSLATSTSYVYGTEDMETDADGKLYLYLPEGARTTTAKTASSKYTGEVITTTDPVTSAGTLFVDAVAPAVYSVTPSGTGAPRSGNIAITFHEEMREGPGAVSLSPDGAGYFPLRPGSWSVANAIYTYTTSYSGLDYNTRYTVKIEGFQDFSGNTMATDTSHTFTTVKRERRSDRSEDVSPAPVYGADISGGGTLEVTVNEESGNASVTAGDNVGAELQSGGNVTITMPSVPGVMSYTLGIPVAHLSTPSGGTLTFTTATGSMTLPADMLSGIPGAEGKTAEITIGAGDKSGLSEAARAAIGDRPLIELSLTLDGAPTEWNNPGSPVTVSIPYEPTPEERQNPDAIVIWYIDGSGNLVCVPNGHYDPETGTVTFETTHFSQYAVGYNPVAFRDVAEGAWYSRAVSFIAARGITSGTGDGNYSPEANLTRGEFMVLMMRAYGIAPDSNPVDNFTDAGNAYYTGYLAAAKRLGITAGVGDNLYAPGREITRQEMFTLLYNALRVIGRLPEGDSGKTLDQFSDAGEIASWAREAMTLLVKTGVVGGSNGNLTPLSTTTRAEMAQALYNLLRK